MRLFPIHTALLSILVAGLSFAGSGCERSSSQTKLQLQEQTCVATIDGWISRADWPTDEILLGDQIYSKQRLFNLSKSKGNAVAELAMQMATAQLNLAVGAEPDTRVIDALFEADDFLLDSREDERRSQAEAAPLQVLVDILASFNQDVANQRSCGSSHPVMTTAMR